MEVESRWWSIRCHVVKLTKVGRGWSSPAWQSLMWVFPKFPVFQFYLSDSICLIILSVICPVIVRLWMIILWICTFININWGLFHVLNIVTSTKIFVQYFVTCMLIRKNIRRQFVDGCNFVKKNRTGGFKELLQRRNFNL